MDEPTMRLCARFFGSGDDWTPNRRRTIPKMDDSFTVGDTVFYTYSDGKVGEFKLMTKEEMDSLGIEWCTDGECSD